MPGDGWHLDARLVLLALAQQRIQRQSSVRIGRARLDVERYCSMLRASAGSGVVRHSYAGLGSAPLLKAGIAGSCRDSSGTLRCGGVRNGKAGASVLCTADLCTASLVLRKAPQSFASQATPGSAAHRPVRQCSAWHIVVGSGSPWLRSPSRARHRNAGSGAVRSGRALLCSPRYRYARHGVLSTNYSQKGA